MLSFLSIAIVLICSWIVWDDFKNREIHVLSILLLFFAIGFRGYLSAEIGSVFWTNLVINLLLVIAIFGSTYLYFIQLRKIREPWMTHLGLGDVLFYVALIGIGTPQFFLVSFLGMLLIAMLVGLIGMQSKEWKTIPLAGISAGVIGIWFVLTIFNFPCVLHLQQLLI